MSFFFEIRRSLNYTPKQMAETYCLRPQTLHDLERGRSLPSAELLQKLEQELGLEGLPCADFLISGREAQKWRRGAAYGLQMVNPEPWIKAEKRWSSLLEELRVPRVTRRWLRRFLPSDSALEVLALYQLATLESRPILGNPHELDFRDQPIVDAFGKALGTRVLPGIAGSSGALRYLLWPQVWLRTSAASYRVDALVLVKVGTKVCWCVLEFDGPHHHLENDLFRQSALGIHHIRFSEHDVKSMNVVRKFLDEIAKLLKEQGIAA